ncbi:AraC family transcriptional regulator [Mesorhizobium sp. WSM4884]|uniref:AraC family transcriptional regulator n=1 Tax=Mesorhizobium sp. WSM4884 TaxID=3038542 RepID=UPI00241721D8|nr:AraC family transcriptional regulator [Mesorhizobium sp. WSM4884]MDG4880766.1 AraC family transcriptional regulator [Mesorhizobium sp. WSM4884]
MGVWLELYARKLFNLEIEPFGSEPFRAEVTLRALPGVSLSAGSRSATHYRIRKHHLSHASDMVMLIAVLAGRCWSTQRNREVTIGSGQAVLMLTSEVATMTLTEGGRYVGVYVPRAPLAPLVPGLDRHLVQPIPCEHEALRLLIDYVRLVQETGPLTTEQVQRGVAAHILDLLLLALVAEGEAAEIAGPGLRTARLRAVKADIGSNLHLSALSAEDVAQRQGVSPDYVRKLFRLEGTSFADYILEQRLLRVHKALRDPRLPASPIGMIAYDAGFGDISYFNRCFRRRFGATPSDIRQASRLS